MQPEIILCKIHWLVATITGSVCILCTVPGAPDISKNNCGVNYRDVGSGSRSLQGGVLEHVLIGLATLCSAWLY